MALAREIPDSFVDAVAAHSADRTSAVSLALAREQHAEYLSQLRTHVPTLCLPAIEAHPDCLFVEDAVVTVGETAVITQPGHASRRGEVESIKIALQQLGMANVYDMRDEERATCDGGDVMFTGRHLFVGLSDRTNSEGFRFLRDAFLDHGLVEEDIIMVPPVVAGKDVLHLKSAVTHLDEQTLLVPEGNVGDSVLEAMKASERKYDAIRLPDVLSCNVVVANGHLLAQDAPWRCPTPDRGSLQRAGFGVDVCRYFRAGEEGWGLDVLQRFAFRVKEKAISRGKGRQQASRTRGK